MSGETSADKHELFLNYLGKGTDVVTTCEDWRRKHKLGISVSCREVRSSGANCNIEPRSSGPETWSEYDSRTRSNSVRVGGKVKGGAGAAGVPVFS